MINILFVDRRNSARSVLAEALLNRVGAGRFEACSAGFDPEAAISPYVLGLLHGMRYNTSLLATKPVEAMISKYAPAFDLIICLSPGMPQGGRWPKAPVMVDWHIEDPRTVYKEKARLAQAYRDMFDDLAHRLDALAQQPAESFRDGRIARWFDRLDTVSMRIAG